METSFFPLSTAISFSADEEHWAFQTEKGLLWGEVDTQPNPVELPDNHLLVQYSHRGMVTRCGFRRYWTSFQEQRLIAIPHGCTKPKIYNDSVYWNEEGHFYCWDSSRGTRQVGYMLEEFEDYLIGPNDWIAITTSQGIHFMHHGHSYFVSDVLEALFHRDEERVLLSRHEGIEILSLQEQRFSTQYFPECDELVGFTEFPMILGLEKRYFFTTSIYIQEPEGRGPEFSPYGIVMRNEHSILGLSGSMWSCNDDSTPKWIEDIPDFDNGWVGDSGFLLLIEEQLLYVNNQGDFELIHDDVANTELEDDDVLEIEDLGVFIHYSRVEKSPVQVHGFQFDDSVQSWAWSNHGMWINLR